MTQTIDSGTGSSTGTGKIVTFYSFKGGVGRTMAVANLAFLAALNGKRVLVMDWDLEAPGLAYYFRGMLDAVDNLAFDATPGVLDILCEWRAALDAAESEEAIDLLQQRMEAGQPFQDCVRPLVQATLAEALFPATACLDIIGPGARTIASLNNMPYEEALAQFSWQKFFEQQAGGFVLEKMRLWAKNHYDFIFIDSRTGLVDIAGICTMQLPDIVALCFALNQQNIDGIARVAAAIHAQRNNDVILRAVPMRVAQRDSAQESEAQARAASALTRIGGFDRAALKIDMEELSIPLVDHLPFYETLAPFVAKDPALDQLTLSYLRLGKKLFDPSLTIPDFNQTAIAEIKQRLQPRNATVEYLESLRLADPERADGELQQFTESAGVTVMHGGTLEATYILALLDVGLYIVEKTEEPEPKIVLIDKILNIARTLNNREPEIWQNTLRFAIERVLEYSFFPSNRKNEIKLWKELDTILALTPSIAINLKRIENFFKASQL
jgi:cellulose biosynthesis protein BcsQ